MRGYGTRRIPICRCCHGLDAWHKGDRARGRREALKEIWEGGGTLDTRRLGRRAPNKERGGWNPPPPTNHDGAVAELVDAETLNPSVSGRPGPTPGGPTNEKVEGMGHGDRKTLIRS